jgi:hypothetical protein
VSAVLFSVVVVAPPAARAADYNFTLIAETSDELEKLLNLPSINNLGQVSFAAETANGIGIYVGDGTAAPAQRIQPAELYRLGGAYTQTPIDDSGHVAFFGTLDDVYGIFRVAPSLAIETVFAGDFFEVVPVGQIAQSPSGTVGYLGKTYPDFYLQTYTSYDTTTPTFQDDPLEGIWIDSYAVDVNDAGTVAATRQNANQIRELFTVDTAGNVAVIASMESEFLQLFSDFDFNNSGAVAFLGQDASGQYGLFLHTGGTTLRVAQDVIRFALNDLGNVAYLGRNDSSQMALFAGNDQLAQSVIATGDELFGSTILSLFYSSDPYEGLLGLNNQGQIAFWARLSDGRDVFIRADPVLIPEPATALLALLSALCLVATRRRKRT